jgi:hypothetical protein
MATNGGLATVQGYLQPNGFEQVAVLTAAVGITPVQLSKLAMIQAEGQNVRWRDDGTNPTPTVGMILVANDVLIYSGTLSSIKFIEVTATAKINVTYYK